MASEGFKSRPLEWDPEYAEWRKPFGDQTRVPVYKTVLEFREFNATIMRFLWSQLPPQPSIQRTVYKVPSYDGVEIEVTRFATAAQAASDKPLPAWLYLHGGGMVAVTVKDFAPQIAKWAADSGVQVFGVEYRLAPEHPDPAPVEDCYAALAWLSARAGEFGVDRTRLGIMGDSAGGGLAAGAALLARDRALQPPLARQLLIYPMLDDRTITTLTPESPLAPFATVPLENLILCWQAYLGDEKAGKPDVEVSVYAAPSRATDLRGLPPTYIDVGNLDLFRDECAMFAARLAAADVDVEFNMFSGVPHAFEGAWNIGITQRAVAARLRVMKRL
ncbi:Alpha/Beta hydrolase protein [Xylariales sp. PMI_506]|nr:Alpha/Beta hydrolase protein [Xylariales sp. PMI_506]